MDSLYQENILEHYKHPHNRRRMEDADVIKKGHNASCGDDIVIYLKLGADDTIGDISFEGFGCAISQSGASMLTDKVKGVQKKTILGFTQKEMNELYGIEVGPAREKCAMLALRTLQEAISEK